MKRDAPLSLTVFVVIVVTTVWATSLVISLLLQDYQVLLYTSPPMLAVVGYATGIRLGKNGAPD